MLVFLVLLVGLASEAMSSQEELYIDFRRTGGFAGIETTAKIHGDSLVSDELSKLTELISQSDFFGFDEKDSTANKIPDQFQYKIAIKYHGQHRVLEFDEGTIPERFSDLIRFLTRKARSMGKD